MKECEYCNSVHDGNYASGRFCSTKCSSAFSTSKNRKLISAKTAKTIKEKLLSSEPSGFGDINPLIIFSKCPECNKEFKQKNPPLTYCSRECVRKSKVVRAKLSKGTKGKCGGYKEGSGIGKSGWYKGIYCDSSWELAYVIYCKDHGINIERNKEPRFYIWEGKGLKYFPDFIVEKEIVEIKGRKTKQWEAKISNNPDIKVIYGKEMKPILSYIEGKYGNNFIALYENSDIYKYSNKCKNCEKACLKRNNFCSVSCSLKYRHSHNKS